jgi:hypothetical protein
VLGDAALSSMLGGVMWYVIEVESNSTARVMEALCLLGVEPSSCGWFWTGRMQKRKRPKMDDRRRTMPSGRVMRCEFEQTLTITPRGLLRLLSRHGVEGYLGVYESSAELVRDAHPPLRFNAADPRDYRQWVR